MGRRGGREGKGEGSGEGAGTRLCPSPTPLSLLPEEGGAGIGPGCGAESMYSSRRGGGTRKRHFRLIIPASFPPKPLPAPISGYFRSEEVYFLFYSLPPSTTSGPQALLPVLLQQLPVAGKPLPPPASLPPHPTPNNFRVSLSFSLRPQLPVLLSFSPPPFPVALTGSGGGDAEGGAAAAGVARRHRDVIGRGRK